jgi:dethiobiotin synthetase
MNKSFIVAGIGTEIGKTFISAIFTQALQADYWKPIQSGNPEDADALFIEKMTRLPQLKIWESAYVLSQPLSPHTAAEIDGVTIDLQKIQLPPTNNSLIVELAGGVLVPINDDQTNLDLIKKLDLPVLLVSKNYLGSINHTLLTYQILKDHQIPIMGIVFNGPSNPSGEKFILKFTQLPVVLRVQQEEEITPETILKYAQSISNESVRKR